MEQQILIVPILFAAGFLQGVTGFGSALVAVPLLSLVVDVKFAIPLTVLSGLPITFFLCLKLRSFLDWQKLFPLCAATLPGILFGVMVLKNVGSQAIALALGVMIAGYGAYTLFFSPKRREVRRGWVYVAGFLSGAIGSAFSAGGPPVIIYATMNNWGKDSIKATLTGFFFFNSVIIALAHWGTGITSQTIFTTFLYALPFIVGGTALGSFCYSYFRDAGYLRIISILLIVMGVMMISVKV